MADPVINPGPITTVNPPIVISTPWYADKSLYLVVLAPLLLILSKKLGVDLNATEIAGVVASIVMFIASSKWKNASLTGKAIEAGALAAQPTTGTAVAPINK